MLMRFCSDPLAGTRWLSDERQSSRVPGSGGGVNWCRPNARLQVDDRERGSFGRHSDYADFELAHSHHTAVHLLTTPDQVRLSVEDDGRGFDPNQVEAGRFGLIGLNERVKLLGGRFLLDSIPGSGTRLEILLPLQA